MRCENPDTIVFLCLKTGKNELLSLKTDKPEMLKKKKGRKLKRNIEPKKSNKKTKITDVFLK